MDTFLNKLSKAIMQYTKAIGVLREQYEHSTRDEFHLSDKINILRKERSDLLTIKKEHTIYLREDGYQVSLTDFSVNLPAPVKDYFENNAKHLPDVDQLVYGKEAKDNVLEHFEVPVDEC